MPRDGTATRNRILDTAEAMILDQGYSATSIDKLIDHVMQAKSRAELTTAVRARLASASLARPGCRWTGTDGR